MAGKKPKLSAKQFYAKYWDDAVKATEGTGIYPEVLMAQFAQESTWGESANEANGYATFGVKAGDGINPDSYDGDSKLLKTTEYNPKTKQNEPVYRYFRSYANTGEAMADYVKNLQQYPGYKKAGVFTANSVDEQIDAIAKAGYASNPSYAQAIKDKVHDAQDMGLGEGSRFDLEGDGVGYIKDENGVWTAYRKSVDDRKKRGLSTSNQTGNWQDDYDTQKVLGEGLIKVGNHVYAFGENGDQGKTIKQMPSSTMLGNNMSQHHFNVFDKTNIMKPKQFGGWAQEQLDLMESEMKRDGQLSIGNKAGMERILQLAQNELPREEFGEFQYNVNKQLVLPAVQYDLDVAEKAMREKRDYYKNKAFQENDPKRREIFTSKGAQLSDDIAEFLREKVQMEIDLEQISSGLDKEHEYGDARDLPVIGHVIKLIGWAGGAADSGDEDEGYMVANDARKQMHDKISRLTELSNRYKPYFQGTSSFDKELNSQNRQKNSNTYYPGTAGSTARSRSSTTRVSGTPNIEIGAVPGVTPYQPGAPVDYREDAMDLDDRASKDESGKVIPKEETDPKKLKEKMESLDAEINELQKPTPSPQVQMQNQQQGIGADLLDIGRGVMGLRGAMKEVPVYERGEMFQTAMQEMTDRRDLGLSADEIAFAKNLAERGYGYDVKNIRRLAGGSAGVALGNLGRATGQLQQQYAQLATRDEAARRLNRQQFYQGAAQDEAINRQIFEDELQQTMMTKQAGAGLLNDALSNIRERAQFNQAYGPDSQYYKYQEALIKDANMRAEGMELANKERRDEIIKQKQEQRDKINQQYEGITNNRTDVNADTQVATQTTTTVTENAPEGETGVSTDTTPQADGSGIIKTSGTDVPTVQIKDEDLPGDNVPTDTPTDVTTGAPKENQKVDDAGNVLEQDENGIWQPTDQKGKDYYAKRKKINDAVEATRQENEEGKSVYSVPDELPEGVTKEEMEAAVEQYNTRGLRRKISKGKEEGKVTDVSEMEEEEMTLDTAPGGGIIADAGADEVKPTTTTKVEQGEKLKSSTGKKLNELTNEELEEEGIKRVVTQNEDGTIAVNYQGPTEAREGKGAGNIAQVDVYKSQFNDDSSPSNVASIKSQMLGDNEEYAQSKKALDDEYNVKFKELENLITEYEEKGRFSKADKERKKLKKLRSEYSEKGNNVYKKYMDEIDSIVEGWKNS